MAPRRPTTDVNRIRFVAAVLALVGATIWVTYVLARGWVRPGTAVIPIYFALLVGGVALTWWWRDRAAVEGLESVHDAERSRLEDELGRREEALRAERERREQAERARSSERNLVKKLRHQVLEEQHRRGAFADPSDTPHLVLRLVMSLVEAERGLLLSRGDEDRDGDLDLVAHEGFTSDPSHSPVVQRFAKQVIERDQIVRDNEPAAEGPDRDIHNLIAIPMYIRDEFSGVVVCANSPGGFDEHDDEVLLAIGDHAGAVLQSSTLRGELRSSYLGTVRILADALAAKDPFLRGHSNEVSNYVSLVANRLDLDASKREQLVFASLLHDLGKIGVSERILLKPGPLTAEEFNIVKLHSRIGARLVEQVPGLSDMSPALLHHHERFDGGGYPGGLRGEEIPLEGRIICVADSFSAMTSDRPYRGRLPLESALQELERCAGTQFDPEVVRLFIEVVRADPPRGDLASEVALALDDTEVKVLRIEDEPVLGYGSYAITDNLTLLYSHRYLHEIAQAEAERAELQDGTFSVIFFEIADIDAINVERGYAAGDETIRRVAAHLQSAGLREGASACRYGGAKLALLVPGATQQQAHRIVAEVTQDLGDEIHIVGAASAWRRGDAGSDVIARAKAAVTAREPAGPPPAT